MRKIKESAAFQIYEKMNKDMIDRDEVPGKDDGE